MNFRRRHVLTLSAGVLAGCQADSLQIPQAPDMGKIAQCGEPGKLTRGRLARLLVDECGNLLAPEIACQGEPPEPCTGCAASGNEDGSDDQIKAMEELCRKGLIEKFPDRQYKPCQGVTNAEFAVVVMNALNLETVAGNFNQWWEAAFETLKRKGLLPPEDAQNPAGSPSEEFMKRLLKFCQAGGK